MSTFSSARRRQRNNRSDFLADSAQREDLLDPDVIENLSNNEEVTKTLQKTVRVFLVILVKLDS